MTGKSPVSGLKRLNAGREAVLRGETEPRLSESLISYHIEGYYIDDMVAEARDRGEKLIQFLAFMLRTNPGTFSSDSQKETLFFNLYGRRQIPLLRNDFVNMEVGSGEEMGHFYDVFLNNRPEIIYGAGR